jgi:hypothetical protein
VEIVHTDEVAATPSRMTRLLRQKRKEKKRKTEDEKGLTCHFPADIRSLPLDTGSYHAGIDTQAVDNGGRQWKD